MPAGDPELSPSTSAAVTRALDLSGMRPVYVLRSWTLSRRLLTGCGAAVIGSAIPRVVENRRDVTDIAWTLLPVLVGALLVFALITRPPAVAFTGEGVRIRSSLRFGPLVPWSEVREVKVQGRWDDEPSIRLTLNGHLRRQSLRGMPEEDVGRLAEAFAAGTAVKAASRLGQQVDENPV